MLKALLVVGTRPNFVKAAALVEAARQFTNIALMLVHTGQHYDRKLSQCFFDDLGIPEPDIHLGVGSGSHASQTAEIMMRFEPVLMKEQPDIVIVVGDVNSTLACALTAVKIGIPVAHVEAGLRSFDRTMPEEINRVVTDAISDLHFVSEPSGVLNLRREGISNEKIHFVGNVMIDVLYRHRRRSEQSTILSKLRLETTGYALLTLHRANNVDDPKVLGELLHAVVAVADGLPIVFPVHPRTRKMLDETVFSDGCSAILDQIRMTEPLSYIDFLKLMSCARFVATDSGGVQEETTALGVPCLTLRDNTERPVTVDMGTNHLAGRKYESIVRIATQALHDRQRKARMPDKWDGRAAERIWSVLLAADYSKHNGRVPSCSRNIACKH